MSDFKSGNHSGKANPDCTLAGKAKGRGTTQASTSPDRSGHQRGMKSQSPGKAP